MARTRIDERLIQEGLAEGPEVARGLIMGGHVLVNDKPVTKPGFQVRGGDSIRLRNVRRFVSRGGEKIDPVLEAWSFRVEGRVFLDLGASTGGFSDALLQRGASKVYALDVAYGLLDDKIRSNPRVRVLERRHVCSLEAADLPEKPDAFVADLSFISLRKVIPCLRRLYGAWEGLVLFKPQFEVAEGELVGGVVEDEGARLAALNQFRAFLDTLDVEVIDSRESSLPGAKGNREFFLWLRWG